MCDVVGQVLKRVFAACTEQSAKSAFLAMNHHSARTSLVGLLNLENTLDSLSFKGILKCLTAFVLADGTEVADDSLAWRLLLETPTASASGV